MPRTLLFAYGLLQPAFNPPKTLAKHWADRVHGKLFSLGPYPAAVELEQVESWIHGTVLDIDDEELASLDEFEEVERGEYRRIRVTTELGWEVWAYEYARAVPNELMQIDRWPALVAP